MSLKIPRVLVQHFQSLARLPCSPSLNKRQHTDVRSFIDKWAETTNIHTQDPLCYKPISLLECQYKVFSTIIYNRIKKHIYDNGHISSNQLEFKKGASTHNRIISLINTLEDTKQFHKNIHIASIDLVKAYDSAQHWAIKQALLGANLNPGIIQIIKNMHTGT
jgi:hypothetical protein